MKTATQTTTEELLFPEPGRLYILADYWPRVHAAREAGREIDNNRAHDFISVHRDTWSPTFSLLSPLRLIDRQAPTRPDFEKETFETREAATASALELAAHHGAFVVDCTRA